MNDLYKIVEEYTNFIVEGKKVQIPYSIVGNQMSSDEKLNSGRTTKFSNFAGKGTPNQIRLTLIKKAKKEGFDLSRKKSEEITQFLICQGIGVDCSGFVYNTLNSHLKNTAHISLDKLILRFSGTIGRFERFLFSRNRVRKCSAEVLTNELNSFKVERVRDILPGDMIRLTHRNWMGKHIALIVNVTKDYLVYAHSSEYTKENGPHFAKIRILSPDEGLEKQEWLEKTYNGKDYGRDAFLLDKGDSVRRLKYYESKTNN